MSVKATPCCGTKDLQARMTNQMPALYPLRGGRITAQCLVAFCTALTSKIAMPDEMENCVTRSGMRTASWMPVAAPDRSDFKSSDCS
jgi:hypothetical protein